MDRRLPRLRRVRIGGEKSSEQGPVALNLEIPRVQQVLGFLRGYKRGRRLHRPSLNRQTMVSSLRRISLKVVA